MQRLNKWTENDAWVTVIGLVRETPLLYTVLMTNEELGHTTWKETEMMPKEFLTQDTSWWGGGRKAETPVTQTLVSPLHH